MTGSAMVVEGLFWIAMAFGLTIGLCYLVVEYAHYERRRREREQREQREWERQHRPMPTAGSKILEWEAQLIQHRIEIMRARKLVRETLGLEKPTAGTSASPEKSPGAPVTRCDGTTSANQDRP